MINKIQMEQARKAAEEAKSIYENMKKDALKQVIRAMVEDGGEYTASELAQFTGLNTQTIASAFRTGFHGGILAKIANEERSYSRRIVCGTRETEYIYVRQNPDGTYDEDKKIRVKNEVTTYQVVTNR